MSAIEPQYQTFWPRFWAGWIDFLIFAPLIWVDTLIWDNVNIPVLLVTWYLVYWFSTEVYSVILHGLYGQTIGKRLMKVRVLDLSGSKLSVRQAIIRDSVPIASMLWGVLVDLPDVANGVNPANNADVSPSQWAWMATANGWVILELATMLLSSKRRAIHDYMAHSVVVRVDAKRTTSEAAATQGT